MNLGRVNLIKYGIPSVIVAAGIATASIVMNTDTSTTKPSISAPSIDGATQTTIAADSQPVQTTPTPGGAGSGTTKTTTTTSTPSTTTTTPTSSAYGEDPNRPGYFIVFDKTSVMTSAGIPADQQAAADAVITRLSGWTYSSPTPKPPQQKFQQTLCNPYPYDKMSGPEAIAGTEDWPTNPVSQLKWCHKIVGLIWGTWADIPADVTHF